MSVVSSYRRCKCRDESGKKELGAKCSKLRRRDGSWNPSHGTWYGKTTRTLSGPSPDLSPARTLIPSKLAPMRPAALRRTPPDNEHELALNNNRHSDVHGIRHLAGQSAQQARPMLRRDLACCATVVPASARHSGTTPGGIEGSSCSQGIAHSGLKRCGGLCRCRTDTDRQPTPARLAALRAVRRCEVAVPCRTGSGTVATTLVSPSTSPHAASRF
jgi:hypothetical protein